MAASQRKQQGIERVQEQRTRGESERSTGGVACGQADASSGACAYAVLNFARCACEFSSQQSTHHPACHGETGAGVEASGLGLHPKSWWGFYLPSDRSARG